MIVLACVPETKTFEKVAEDPRGLVGWVIPCADDPYSEPYLALIAGSNWWNNPVASGSPKAVSR